MTNEGVKYSIKITNSFQVFFTALLAIKVFFSSIYELKVFHIVENVFTVFNGIFSTIYCGLLLIALIFLWLYAFTSKVDTIDFTYPSPENNLKVWAKRILYYSHSLAFVVLTSMAGHQYLSTIAVVVLAMDIISLFLTSKVKIKSAMLFLSEGKNE